MTEPVSSIRNLGPAVEAACARAGIHDADTLRDLGPDAAYEAMIKGGMQAHFIGYYAIVMGLQGRPWNDCRGKEKDALRARFDAIKTRASASEDAGASALDRALREIGVITKS